MLPLLDAVISSLPHLVALCTPPTFVREASEALTAPHLTGVFDLPSQAQRLLCQTPDPPPE